MTWPINWFNIQNFYYSNQHIYIALNCTCWTYRPWVNVLNLHSITPLGSTTGIILNSCRDSLEVEAVMQSWMWCWTLSFMVLLFYCCKYKYTVLYEVWFRESESVCADKARTMLQNWTFKVKVTVITFYYYSPIIMYSTVILICPLCFYYCCFQVQLLLALQQIIIMLIMKQQILFKVMDFQLRCRRQPAVIIGHRRDFCSNSLTMFSPK